MCILTYYILLKVAAAAKLGISKTALKNACRKLGLHRWPFMKRREDLRRSGNTALKDAKTSSSCTNSSNNNTDSSNDKSSPALDSMEDDDDDSGSELDEHDARALGEQAADVSDAACASSAAEAAVVSLLTTNSCSRDSPSRKHASNSRIFTPWAGGGQIIIKKKDGKTEDGKMEGGLGVSRSFGGGVLVGSLTPPLDAMPDVMQKLSRSGSQDEDDLFNVGCNHTASEMWTSFGAAAQECLAPPKNTLNTQDYHLHVSLSSDENQARDSSVSIVSIRIIVFFFYNIRPVLDLLVHAMRCTYTPTTWRTSQYTYALRLVRRDGQSRRRLCPIFC